MVGSRFVKAVELANEWHVAQVRKGSSIPYIAHLLGVASLVLEAGGDEDMAIAALLHDAIEDVEVPVERIRHEFGSRVADIVLECTDVSPGKERSERNWDERREGALERLEEADHDALVVSCADKLHNARAIRRDLEREGPALWDRFNQKKPERQRWFYESLSEVFDRRLRDPRWLPEELTRTVREIFPGPDPRVG